MPSTMTAGCGTSGNAVAFRDQIVTTVRKRELTRAYDTALFRYPRQELPPSQGTTGGRRRGRCHWRRPALRNRAPLALQPVQPYDERRRTNNGDDETGYCHGGTSPTEGYGPSGLEARGICPAPVILASRKHLMRRRRWPAQPQRRKPRSPISYAVAPSERQPGLLSFLLVSVGSRVVLIDVFVRSSVGSRNGAVRVWAPGPAPPYWPARCSLV